MINLKHLELSSSSITDDAIKHVARIGTNLKYFSLKDTGINSQALCVLAGTVPNLISLSSAHTKVDDSALAYIRMMPLLRTKDLSNACIEGFAYTEVNVEKILSMSKFENLRYLESLNEGTPLMAESIPPLTSVTALKYLSLRSDFLSDPSLHALSSASNLVHLGFCGTILSSSGLLEFMPPAKLCVLDLRGCWILTGDAISVFCRRHTRIEVKHELIQELNANNVGTSQLHKPKKSQLVKAKAAKSFAGPDERIKYTKEELLELQHLVESNLAIHAM